MDEIMTLQQKMDTLADDEIVHIGAKSGYFFCGTKAEYEADIDSVSDELLADMQKVRAALRQAKAKYPGKFAKLVELGPADDEMTLKKVAQRAWALSRAADKLIQVNRRLPVVEQNIDEFKPARERTVLDFYPCLDEEAGVNIIVEGVEDGRYWTLDEYRNGVAPENDDPEDEEDEE